MTERLREAARRFSKPFLADGYKPVGLHRFTNRRGRPLFWRLRVKHPVTGKKEIRPFHHNGTRFELGEPKFPDGKPLYALFRIARNPDAVVWIVEGEQKADALNKLGLVATTSGGATSAAATDFKPLQSRTVRIWPDNDDPGKAYAGEVAGILMGMGCSISCIDVDRLGLGNGEDVMEWLAARPGAAGGDIEALPILTPASPRGKAPAGDSDGRHDALEPEPLRATLPPAEPYPVEALGDVLGSAARAIHESVKAPLALCCQSVLAAASLAAQAHYDIKLPWGERKPLSLFLLTVGESGERKSGVDNLVLGAAKVQERIEMEAYAQEFAAYETDLAAWTQATDVARKAVTAGKKGAATASDVRMAAERCGGKPVPPMAPLRFVTDPTVEGLFKLLVIGKPSVALFSDEGGLLIGGHALNSDNALKTMARWCKLWDGSPFDRVRAGDGAGILYGRRMALHQLAQPDVMAKLLSDRMANGQGLLARCLVAWPESTIGTRHVECFEWAGDRRELKRLFAVLKGLMEAEPRAGQTAQELDPVELPLTESANALAVAAGNQFETLMAAGADLAELRDRTSKALENACRIAGVLAVIEGGLSVRAIDIGHLERALILMQWYLAEALRIRGAAAIPQSVFDAELLSAWLRGKGIKQFRSKQVLKSGPNQLRNKTRLMAASNELVTNGYLAENEKGVVVDGVAARKSWRVLHHVV